MAMEPFTGLSRLMPPLKRRKNPSLAAIIGLLFGGIGLGIYFASLVDFIIPIAITVILVITVQTNGVGAIVGAIIAGVWGLVRAIASNAKLEAVSIDKPSTT